MGSEAYVVEMVLGPLLVKEGHGMGEMAGLQASSFNWRK